MTRNVFMTEKRIFSFCRSSRLAVVTFALAIGLSACGTTDQEASIQPAGSHNYPTVSGEARPAQGNAPSTRPFDQVSANSRIQGPGPTPVSFTRNRNAPPPPTITAKAAILIDGRGRVLFEKNANSRMPVASTQKLLLGILIADNGNLHKPVTVADSDTWAEPTKMGIKAGQVYTRQELLRAVLVRSSNDIANCLARDHSGSVSAFAANLTRKAHQLGMHNSRFTNAHGLPSPPGQYSTARDLATLAVAAQKRPVIRDAVRTRAMVFRFSNGTTKTISNTNQVLRHFPYCTGMKTGYTNAAGKCLVSSASNGNKSCIAVILGSKTPTVWMETEALLRYGLGM